MLERPIDQPVCVLNDFFALTSLGATHPSLSHLRGMGRDHNSILAVSPDRGLAQFRHEALVGAGFHVYSVYSESSARFEISFGRCGVLLLCHTLKKDSRDDLAAYFHKWCPSPCVVSILAHHRDTYPSQTSICVVHSEDPGALVQALRNQMAA